MILSGSRPANSIVSVKDPAQLATDGVRHKMNACACPKYKLLFFVPPKHFEKEKRAKCDKRGENCHEKKGQIT